MAQTLEKHHVVWYRSTLFAALLVAMTAFCEPGIFSALNGMGAGGGASPDITNAANAIVFGVLAVASLFTSGVVNRITPKWGLVIGTLDYTPYAAGLYCNDRFGTNWLLLFGSVILGLAAAFLWVSSGAILLGYSEESRKGRAMAFKFGLQSLAGSIGGIISLALNIKKAWRGSISTPTYVVLMVIMSVGWLFALALPTARQIQRVDGRPVHLVKQATFFKEFRVLKSIFTRPAILALIPFWIYGQWNLSYQWQFNFAYFTVRARALNSTLFYLVGLVSALVLGQLLDHTRWSRPARAKIGFLVLVVLVGTGWILGQAVQVHYSNTKPTLDWSSDGYGLGAFLFTLWGFCDPMVSVFNYWLCGCLSNDLNETTMITALINSISCLGSTFAFVVSAVHVDYNWACGINLLLFGISLPGVAWVVFTQIMETTQSTFAKGAGLAVHESENVAPSASANEEKGSRFIVKEIPQ
ncbi:hypothetical protein M409DRAFT_24740 [Zasmidium cellare ATCC 36951]|uniref:Major facilitator superfamily (MFS) profile domain-containing protein n=1 Tax=Zasmidium cellare ATCC 36951 TaxID=1080233 RepID=A0A6A6CCP1_ZASCE|nr:uncharacterized protein M409DRAFT_24740 [Zasmidium cellare ATCC 36951]KAF2164835.1 hypothetical protein M409DRAFT_24740 [Zasmidium cellare ATCC 36951]